MKPPVTRTGKDAGLQDNAPDARRLRANAQACRELADEFRAVVDALDSGRLRAGGPRQRQRISASADAFERQADDDLAELEEQGLS